MLSWIRNLLTGGASTSLIKYHTPPTKDDVIALMKALKFPHGHLALGSLLMLGPEDRELAANAAEWFAAYPEETDAILEDLQKSRRAAQTVAISPSSIIWPKEGE